MDLAIDVAVQVDLDRIVAQLLDRLEDADDLLVQVDAKILLDRVSDVLRGHRAEQPLPSARTDFDPEPFAVQLARDLLRRGLRLFEHFRQPRIAGLQNLQLGLVSDDRHALGE